MGLLVNTLAADEKYPVLNKDNLTILIQMSLSKKKKTFPQFLLRLWNLDKILNILTIKMTLIDFAISKLRTPKAKSDKCLKSPILDNPSTSNMLNVL